MLLNRLGAAARGRSGAAGGGPSRGGRPPSLVDAAPTTPAASSGLAPYPALKTSIKVIRDQQECSSSPLALLAATCSRVGTSPAAGTGAGPPAPAATAVTSVVAQQEQETILATQQQQIRIVSSHFLQQLQAAQQGDVAALAAAAAAAGVGAATPGAPSPPPSQQCQQQASPTAAAGQGHVLNFTQLQNLLPQQMTVAAAESQSSQVQGHASVTSTAVKTLMSSTGGSTVVSLQGVPSQFLQVCNLRSVRSENAGVT